MDRHRLVQPDLERTPPRHFRAVLVMVILVDFHPDHVLEGRIGRLRVGHDAVCGDRRVPDVLHAAEVGVLHGDLPVDRSRVGVTRGDGCKEPGKCFPGSCEGFLVPGSLRRVPHPGESPDLLPGFPVAVLFRAGEEVDPHHRVRQDLERALCGRRVGAGFYKEFEGERPAVGVFELPPAGVVAPHAEEEEIGGHRGRGVAVLLDGTAGPEGVARSSRVAV